MKFIFLILLYIYKNFFVFSYSRIFLLHFDDRIIY